MSDLPLDKSLANTPDDPGNIAGTRRTSTSPASAPDAPDAAGSCDAALVELAGRPSPGERPRVTHALVAEMGKALGCTQGEDWSLAPAWFCTVHQCRWGHLGCDRARHAAQTALEAAATRPEGVVRFGVNLAKDVAGALRALCARHGVDATEGARRAIALWKLVSDENANGNRVVVEYATEPRTFREVLIG